MVPPEPSHWYGMPDPMRALNPNLKAFSLIEVVLALGICSFCLTVLIGLLPIGLNSIKSTQMQDSAAQCLARISASVTEAIPDGSTPPNYSVPDVYTNLTWTQGGAAATNDFHMTADGNLTNATSSSVRLVSHVVINPPTTALDSGKAMISVAWPAAATWNTTSGKWVNAQGSVSTYLIFSPN